VCKSIGKKTAEKLAEKPKERVDPCSQNEQLIRMCHFLSWGPKSYVKENQTLAPAKRYHQEKLSICFATTAFAVN
jgi:hypothetical protein